MERGITEQFSASGQTCTTVWRLRDYYFEKNYRERANKFCLTVLGAHLPCITAIAALFSDHAWTALWLGIFLLTPSAALYVIKRDSPVTSSTLGATAMAFIALLIHVGHGMIEMHFHIFAAMAFLIVFGSVWPIVIATVTIAVHHIRFGRGCHAASSTIRLVSASWYRTPHLSSLKLIRRVG